jgi:hypothetical protein
LTGDGGNKGCARVGNGSIDVTEEDIGSDCGAREDGGSKGCARVGNESIDGTEEDIGSNGGAREDGRSKGGAIGGFKTGTSGFCWPKLDDGLVSDFGMGRYTGSGCVLISDVTKAGGNISGTRGFTGSAFFSGRFKDFLDSAASQEFCKSGLSVST